MKVYISSGQYNSQDKYERIQGVIDYVNILLDGLYELDELEPQALQIYYVDYYTTQVMREGHLKFFLTSSEDENLLPLIFSGLKRMGAHDNHRLLASACEALCLGSDEAEIAERLQQIDEQFDLLSEKLFEFNYEYVSKIQNLTIVPVLLFQKLMQNLIDSVPDQLERAFAAQNEADNNEYVQLAIEICDQFGLDFTQLNGLDSGEDLLDASRVHYNLRHDITYLHLDTDAGYHYITLEGGRATLVNGLTGHIVGEVLIQ